MSDHSKAAAGHERAITSTVSCISAPPCASGDDAAVGKSRQVGGLPWTQSCDEGDAGMSEDNTRAPLGSRYADQRPYVVVADLGEWRGPIAGEARLDRRLNW